MSARKLVVKIISGRGLKNKETFQTSDPYCLVEVGTENHKTKHVSSNLNPDWNEEFVFNLPDDKINVLSLSVWDKNTIKKDVFMGYTFVTFDDCKSYVETTKTVDMMGGLSGQITLSIVPEYETSASKIERLDKEVKTVKVVDMQTKKDLEDANTKIAGLISEKEMLEKQIIVLSQSDNAISEISELKEKEIHVLQEQITVHETKITELSTTITVLQVRLNDYDKIFKDLLNEEKIIVKVRVGMDMLYMKNQ